ncbi:MAG: DHH family phosphoesterase [Clostridiales bacterium]|nr:DHH family phosphoesterase [Clostridiales bacterium]
MTKLDELAALIGNKNVVIQTHNFPDPDAVATAFGLQYLLSTRNISADIVYFGKIDRVTLKLMTEQLKIKLILVDDFTGTEDDLVINVDGQKNNANFTDLIGHEIACIDHHPWVTEYEYEFVDHRIVGACATIIYDYFKENNIPIPTNVATALLYAIKIDTQNFTKGVTDADIDAFATLNNLADQALIVRLDSNELEIDDLRAYGAAIQNFVTSKGVGFVHIPFDCPDRLIAMVSSFILSLDCVVLSVVYAERNGGLKFSIRSEVPDFQSGDWVHLALAGIGDGGGHPSMSGGVIFPEMMPTLGDDPDKAIRKRFLQALRALKNQA